MEEQLAVKATRNSPDCPHCGEGWSKCLNTRHSGSFTRRRRQCVNPKCLKRWTTYEQICRVFIQTPNKK